VAKNEDSQMAIDIRTARYPRVTHTVRGFANIKVIQIEAKR